MGYDDEHAIGSVLLDIETAPLSDAAQYLEPIDAPANYKDPIKIEEYVRTKQREQLERAALDVDLCQVVAIGVMQQNGPDPFVMLARDVTDEASMLRAFFAKLDQERIIGFNVLDFDLPVLLRRALYLDIDAPIIQLDRYRHPRVLDLMQLLSYNGKLKYRSQNFYCRRFGIDIEDDAHEGASIPLLFAEGRWDEIAHHVACDIKQLQALARRLGFWRT